MGPEVPPRKFLETAHVSEAEWCKLHEPLSLVTAKQCRTAEVGVPGYSM